MQVSSARARRRAGRSLSRLVDLMKYVRFRAGDRLATARRPLNDGLFNAGVRPQAKMQSPHALRGVAIAGGDDLQLRMKTILGALMPFETDLGSDRVAIAQELQ